MAAMTESQEKNLQEAVEDAISKLVPGLAQHWALAVAYQDAEDNPSRTEYVVVHPTYQPPHVTRGLLIEADEIFTGMER